MRTHGQARSSGQLETAVEQVRRGSADVTTVANAVRLGLPAAPHPGARAPRAGADPHLPRGGPEPHVPERAAASARRPACAPGAQLRHRPGPRPPARGRRPARDGDVSDPAPRLSRPPAVLPVHRARGRGARMVRSRHEAGARLGGRSRARPASGSSSRSRSSSATSGSTSRACSAGSAIALHCASSAIRTSRSSSTRSRACNSDSTAGRRTTRALPRSSSRTSAAGTSSPGCAIPDSCARSPERGAPRALTLAARWAAIDRRVTDLAPAIPLTNRRSVDIVSPRVGNVQHHVTGYTLLEQLWVR